MPFYAVLTCIVLYRRRERAARYVVFAVGFLLPALWGLQFVARHPAIIRDVVLRYEANQSHGDGAVGTLYTFVFSRHLFDIASVYWTFWNPRLLFVDARTMLTGVGGVFLLPVAGAFAVGVARAVGRFDTISILLLGGLVTAPLPASFVNEPEAVRRALAMLPFVVLLAAYGLDYLSSAPSMYARRVAFLAIWSVLIYLVSAQWDDMPHAQAYIRALTIPMAVTGLAALLGRPTVGSLPVRRIAPVALVALGIAQIAYAVAGYHLVAIVTVSLMAAIGLATCLSAKATDQWTRFGPFGAIVLLVFSTSAFGYFYVDYPFIHRIGLIPASAQLVAIRFVGSGAALIALIAMTKVPRLAIVNNVGRRALVIAASLTLVAIQFAYFHIDYFSDSGARFLHVSLLSLALTGLAMLLGRIAVARVRLGQFATAALLGIACMQFTSFYGDYFGGYRVRRTSEAEGNVRVAYETLLERSRGVRVPSGLSRPKDGVCFLARTVLEVLPAKTRSGGFSGSNNERRVV